MKLPTFLPMFFCRASLLVALGGLVIACQEDSSTTSTSAYLGGEIINPKDRTVYITTTDARAIDTLTLDDRNRFLYKFDSLVPGLYSFRLSAADGLEHQIVLVEPNDSIMLRLNTLEFDESLVYTGKGAKKNNYLINLFLESEQDDKKVLGFSQLSPKAFEAHVDSMKALKLKALKKFSSENTVSKRFINLIETNINYDYYLSKEVYPFVNYSSSERNIIKSLPESFYAYRTDIDYSIQNVRDYFPYYPFLKHHFENLALTEHFKTSNDSILNRKCLGYNLTRLKLIDSLVKNDDMKNQLLINTAIEFISDNKNVKDYDSLLVSFKAKSTDRYHTDYLNNIVASLKVLKPGNKLPKLYVYDIDNNTHTLNQLVKNKPTVMYFWRQSYLRHYQDSHKKIEELKVKYPEINFVALNINETSSQAWKDHLKQYKYPTKNEYLFVDPKKAKQDLAIYPINKVILLDNQGKIINAQTNMFSLHFEKQLLEALNQ